MFPSPPDVLQSGLDLIKTGELQEHIRASMTRVLLGFAIGSFFGISLGIFLGRFEVLEALVGPVLQMARAIPPLALVPLIIFWFGVSESAKVLLISWAAFFPVWIATLLGVKATSPLLIRAGRSLGASRFTLLRLVVLPAALSSIFSGMRVSLSLCFTVLVAAELAGAIAGLGYLVQISALSFRVDTIFLGIVVLAILGFFTDLLFMKILYGLFPWYRKEQTAKS
jgi:NitT/TauT family transport system permease protein/sulfonate transport system permease protein